MSKKKGNRVDPDLIPESWFKAVRHALDREDGPTVKALARAARMSRTNLWNTVRGEQPTMSSAFRIAEALTRIDPDSQVPPPMVPVESIEHHRLCSAAARLFYLDRSFFDELLRLAERRAGDVANAQQKDAEAVSALRRLAGVENDA